MQSRLSGETTEPEMLIRFMEGLKQAAGSAGQLAHAQQNPRWLQVRQLLEAVRYNATKMATSSPMPRPEVLKQLDRRREGLKQLDRRVMKRA